MADELNNNVKLVTVFTDSLQNLENALQQLQRERSVDLAVGAQLDVLGRRVKQRRDGRDDDTYRRYIRARIKTNRSSGVINELLSISDLIIYDDDAQFEFDNQGVATGVMRVLNLAVPNELADDLIAFLRDGKAAGVRIILESSADTPANWLRFDEGNFDEQTMLSARDHRSDA